MNNREKFWKIHQKLDENLIFPPEFIEIVNKMTCPEPDERIKLS